MDTRVEISPLPPSLSPFWLETDSFPPGGGNANSWAGREWVLTDLSESFFFENFWISFLRAGGERDWESEFSQPFPLE